jgi:hypothetical protein
MNPSVRLFVSALGAALLATSAGAQFEWGGVLPDDRSSNFKLQLGAVLEFEGMVVETTRRVYEVTGAVESQNRANTFGTDDFNMEGPFGSAGFTWEVDWSFIRFSMDSIFLMPSISTVAKRDYYLSVGDGIDYGGKTYDQLMIADGTPFDAEVLGNMTELTLAFVPFGVALGESFSVNPFLGAGVMLFGGFYEIDAGESTGVIQYQNPPEDFVVGGKASGFVGMFAPQWGPGIEIRMGDPGKMNFELMAQYLFFDYSGSSGLFSTTDHREKDLEFSHSNMRVRGQFEFPRRNGGAWTLGVSAQFIDTDGSLKSSATDPVEILEKRERFDKNFMFKINSVFATLGLAF